MSRKRVRQDCATGDSRFQRPRTPRKNTGTWNRTSRMMKLCIEYMVSQRSSRYSTQAVERTWNQANMGAFAFCSSGSSRAAKRTAYADPPNRVLALFILKNFHPAQRKRSSRRTSCAKPCRRKSLCAEQRLYVCVWVLSSSAADGSRCRGCAHS